MQKDREDIDYIRELSINKEIVLYVYCYWKLYYGLLGNYIWLILIYMKRMNCKLYSFELGDYVRDNCYFLV